MREEWQSDVPPIEFFEAYKSQSATLLLASEGLSRIGIDPIRYFYNIEDAEAYSAVNPEHTLMAYKSYPDAGSKKKSLYQAPQELWILYRKQIEVESVGESFRYRSIQIKGEFSEEAPALLLTDSEVPFYQEGSDEVSLQKDKYLKNVEAIKEEIASGEYYQMNYTFFFRKTTKTDSYEVLKKYFKKNPSNYFSYMNLGNIILISMSPELFARKQGTQLTAMPIKGTLSKKYPLQDLLHSEKDRAELNMITDLFRNDFYQVCDLKSVQVKESRGVIELENLYHLYSEVQGKVLPQKTLKDIFTALFPSGSITGCPKVRSQEAIAKYENCARGVYTGSMGWLQAGDFCFNIAIRTLVYFDNKYYYPVGSGIVYDSKPDLEWEECVLKAKTFFECV